MDAKTEASMASTVVASRPRKTTLKEASIVASQARKWAALVYINSCVHRLIIWAHLHYFRETILIFICSRLPDVRIPEAWALILAATNNASQSAKRES